MARQQRSNAAQYFDGQSTACNARNRYGVSLPSAPRLAGTPADSQAIWFPASSQRGCIPT
jgi:hypothetical protein